MSDKSDNRSSDGSEGRFKDYSTIVGMDPAANFLLGPGWRAFSGGEPDPILQFLVRSSRELIQSLEIEKERWPGFLLSGGSDFDLARQEPTIALTTREYLNVQLGPDANRRFVTAVKQLQLCLPLPRRLVSTIPGDPTFQLPAPPVFGQRPWCDAAVVGIIDDGIALAHERFRRRDGTSRFEYFWNQDGVPRPKGVETVTTGREFGKAEIDQMLQDCRVPGVGVDEDKFYRISGLADFRQSGHKSVAWRLAHGTHVLDLAAGYPSSEDRSDRPLIGVQLPVSATANMSGAGLEAPVIAAISYIQSRAALLTAAGGAPLPVVINFSYGTYLGPHNGRAPLEQQMDDFIQNAPCPTRIVLPAGNSNMVRCHAELTPSRARASKLHFRLQPDSKTLEALEIWLPLEIGSSAGGSRVAIKVISPTGADSGWVEEAAGPGVTLPSGTSLSGPKMPQYAVVTYFSDPETMQGHFRIDLQPTAWDLPGPSCPFVLKAPAGVWRILVKNQGLPGKTKLHAWIERSDLLYGYPRRGRQAYFEAVEDVRFDKQGRPVTDDTNAPDPIRHAEMENAIGTGSLPMVLGGYTGKDRTIADYSAGGTTLSPAAVKRPDALAVSDDSRVHSGVMAAGSRGSSVKAMRGTSVAAPQVTRLVADELALGAASDRAALLVRAAADELGTMPPIPAGRSGAGRLVLPPARTLPDRYWK